MSWKPLLIILGVVLAAAGLLFAVFYFNAFVVDLWWFNALDYGLYFWARVLYQSLIFLVFTLFFFLLFFLNFWIGSRYLGAETPAHHDLEHGSTPDDPTALGAGARPRSKYQRLYDQFQRGSLWFYLPLCLGLALLVALPVFSHWEQALLFFFAPNSGLTDPAFGKDISYYLFSLPLFSLIWHELLAASLILLVGLASLYWLEQQMVAGNRRRMRIGARIHLGLAMGFVVLVGAWYFVMDRQMLLYSDAHVPIFSGPGHVEMTFILALIWACLILFLILGALAILYLETRKGLLALFAIAILFVGTLSFRYSSYVPEQLQKYVVKPNELDLQAPYIKQNIQATLAAYDLQDVETRQYPVQDIPWDTGATDFTKTLVNIPIWDEALLRQVFKELQEIRAYYIFNTVDVDRYTVNDHYQQVAVAAREIDLDKLPAESRNWVNEWMKYTHGYGAVIAPTTQIQAGPIDWLMQGIPPRSNSDLAIEQPGIYYGTGHASPVIAPNESGEIDYASDDELVLSDYEGKGGVGFSSLFRRAIFALYFREVNLLLTNQTNEDSRLLFRRNITERIARLTPFLHLDPHPYPVVTSERVYWIQDTYTLSSWFPYAFSTTADVDGKSRHFNYIRNAAKVVVDAYDGSVNYYITEPDDPIIRAYARAYPGLLKDFDEMPEELKQHVRYPKRLFKIQLDVYSRYHQTNPGIFFKQEDLWEFSEVQWEHELHVMTPYYVTINLLDPDRFEFSLLAPMTPKDKNNMRALLVVGNDGENYGRIMAYSFPRGSLVYGPAQADGFLKQDPVVTQEFALWNRRGAQAQRGRLIVMPIDGVITYIQGVFLKAQTGANIPQLVRFITNVGYRVSMEPSLDGAFNALNRTVLHEEDPSQIEPPVSPPVAPLVTDPNDNQLLPSAPTEDE
ncbi:UPF0182 family protein [Halochromatium salexigens]|nr:UPF0182 family protein [Halochromatium salexigens]